MTKPVIAPVSPAVRTVSETDDIHTIEVRLAYGGPFNGRDSYGTIFSARTDWGLDLHPDGIPVLFNHGFEPDFGLTPIGRTTPTESFRSDADGLWVQIQLDKREKHYATRIRPLLDANGLGVSQGSAEHSVRIDNHTGDVLAWPLHEISLTPTESNPYSIIAARSAETLDALRIVAAVNDPEPEPAIRAGARNSAMDQAHIDAAHDHMVAMGATAHANDQTNPNPAPDGAADDDADDAARSGEPLPTTFRIVERVDPVALRAELIESAKRAGEDAARRLTG